MGTATCADGSAAASWLRSHLTTCARASSGSHTAPGGRGAKPGHLQAGVRLAGLLGVQEAPGELGAAEEHLPAASGRPREPAWVRSTLGAAIAKPACSLLAPVAAETAAMARAGCICEP